MHIGPKTIFVLAASLSILVSLGCSNLTHVKKPGTLTQVPSGISDQIGEYEIESIAEQGLSKLHDYPTLFEISISEGKASYDRLIFFFESYTSGFKPQNAHSEMKTLRIESSNSKDSVLFRVDRKLKGLNVEYAIAVADKKNPKNSKLLAANLARFIREGQLDLQYVPSRH
jgi:hypothetical protein